jgi:hypothetical protein
VKALGIINPATSKHWDLGEKYRLHVNDVGRELIVDDSLMWDGRSVLVTIIGAGETFVIEECETSNYRFEEAIAYGWRSVPPRGSLGWVAVPTESDHWTTWRRWRELKSEARDVRF